MSRLTSACSQVNIESLQMEFHRFSEKDEIIITQRATAVAKGLSQNNHLKRVMLKGVPESCLLYTSPSPRDRQKSRMPSSA